MKSISPGIEGRTVISAQSSMATHVNEMSLISTSS
jgi:hypothetical protein